MSDPIRKALNTRMNTIAGYTIAWENVEQDPPEGVYLETMLLPAQPTQASYGVGGYNRHVGIFQVTVVGRAGDGVAETDTAVQAVIDLFPRGQVVMADGVNVIIESSGPGPGLKDGNRWRVPVSIYYRADRAP